MLDSFKQLITQSSFLSTMVDNPRTVDGPEDAEWTIGYLWDGYMDCAVIFDGKRYRDVQDINIAEGLWNCHGHWTQFNGYGSLEELVNEMEKLGEMG